MYWSWTFEGAESLLGIMVAREVEVISDKGAFLSDLISIGFAIGRVDFLFNTVEKEENDG